MFPIRDDNPHFLTPWVSYAIIALNVVVWLSFQALGQEPRFSQSVCSFGVLPAGLTGLELSADSVCAGQAGGSWFTLVSYMFLHGSWLHIVMNLWFMWIFGNNVEDSMGHLRFALFYLLCGIAAAGLQVLVEPGSGAPMVGASGAIGGVMGAYVLLYPRVNVHLLIFLGFFITTVAVPAFWMLGYWLLLQLLGGLTAQAGEGGVAFWAHVGGFLAGALLIPLFRNPELVARHPYHGWKRASEKSG